MKYYAFKYSSVVSEKFESFGYGFTNFIAPFAVLIFTDWLLRKTPIVDYEWYPICAKIMIAVAFVIAIILVSKYINNARGVFLYEDHIELDRQAISYWHLSKMNFSFDIDELVYCAIEEKDISNYGTRYYNMLGGTASPFVVIKTSKGEQYCFAIEHQEEFVEEVLRRKPELRNREKE